MNLNIIVGLKASAIRGFKKRKNQKHVEAVLIFFDDGETFIRLDEQDYYAYHDCDSYARSLMIIKDKVSYDNYFKNTAEADNFNSNYWDNKLIPKIFPTVM